MRQTVSTFTSLRSFNVEIFLWLMRVSTIHNGTLAPAQFLHHRIWSPLEWSAMHISLTCWLKIVLTIWWVILHHLFINSTLFFLIFSSFKTIFRCGRISFGWRKSSDTLIVQLNYKEMFCRIWVSCSEFAGQCCSHLSRGGVESHLHCCRWMGKKSFSSSTEFSTFLPRRLSLCLR